MVDYPALRASLAPQVRARLEARRAEERARAERERAAQPPPDNGIVEFGRRLFDRLDRGVEDARAAGKIAYDELAVDTDVAKVSVVGIGMRSHAGVAARMFRALADENVNIKVISTSEIKISVLIDRKYMELAVQALHDAFELEKA